MELFIGCCLGAIVVMQFFLHYVLLEIRAELRLINQRQRRSSEPYPPTGD